MTAFEKYINITTQNKSILCIGLDPVLEKLPLKLPKEIKSIEDFCKQIIDSTKDYVCGYKLNFAFFEQFGAEGFEILKKLFDSIPKHLLKIADAKRADIGNTSKAYAKAVFEYFRADSVTVNPYMGEDSIKPFLEYNDKLIFILALTSNFSSEQFQKKIINGRPLYQHVMEEAIKWGKVENIGFVIGATHPEEISETRTIAPDNILLIPGVGAQGGNIEATIKANKNGKAIINVSRSVIYASADLDFADLALEKVLEFNSIINRFRFEV